MDETTVNKNKIYLDHCFLRPGLPAGLYSGKAGILLSYSVLGMSHPSLFKTVAEVIEGELLTCDDYSFSEGITGAGWALQVSAATGTDVGGCNALLMRIDDLVYRKTVQGKSKSLSLYSSNSALGKSFYFYQRVINQKDKPGDYYRGLVDKECLILLISEVSDLLSVLIENKNLLLPQLPHMLLEVGQSFILLYHLLIENINKDFVRKKLIYIRNFINDYFCNLLHIDSQNACNVLYLLYVYALVAFDAKDKDMKTNAIRWIPEIIPLTLPFLKCNTDIYLAITCCNLCNIPLQISYQSPSYAPDFFLWDYCGNLLPWDRGDSSQYSSILKAFLLK